ncbi:MAG: DUF3343 domain-containing protein [Bacillota bacterium]|nr:DUF3343 domain-containing protein [Bacillota bacterium]
MSEKEKIVFVFSSIHHSMEAEDILSKVGFEPDYIQIPGSLGLGCGTGITVAVDQGKNAAGILQENRVPYLAVYSVGADGSWQKLRRLKRGVGKW